MIRRLPFSRLSSTCRSPHRRAISSTSDRPVLIAKKPLVFKNYERLEELVSKGELGKARKMMNDLEPPGADLTCYNILLKGYSLLGDALSLEDILDEMNSKGIPADGESYASLITGFVRVGEVELALESIESMSKRGLSPSLHLCNAFLRGCAASPEKDRIRAMTELFERMAAAAAAGSNSSGPSAAAHDIAPPDATSYDIMIRALLNKSGKSWGKIRSLELLERMRDSGLEPPKSLILHMLRIFTASGVAHGADDVEAAKRLLKIIEK